MRLVMVMRIVQRINSGSFPEGFVLSILDEESAFFASSAARKAEVESNSIKPLFLHVNQH